MCRPPPQDHMTPPLTRGRDPMWGPLQGQLLTSANYRGHTPPASRIMRYNPPVRLLEYNEFAT